MQRTLFQTPVLDALLRGASSLFLRLNGWRVEGALPPGGGKCVLIAAPHTSNWDMPYALTACFVLRLNPRWMGKASIFRFPFGGIMRWLGGVAVDRSRSHNAVADQAQALRESDEPIQLIIAPEGTRKRTREWKTGFYYIAREAGVPIVLAYLDYERRVAGLGRVFQPTGDVQADIAEIKRFYATVRGRNAAQFDAG